MRARLSLTLTLFTLLFLIEGQRVFFSTLYALGARALLPSVRPLALLFAIAPIVVFLLPMLPFPRWFGKRRALMIAIVGCALARVLMGIPDFPARLFTSAIVVGCGALFLSTAIGYLERRALAAGAALAVLADQVLRLFGWSYDPTLRQLWIPAQAFEAILVMMLLYMWTQVPRTERREARLERRAGGLRLRSAVAFGLIIFLETNVLAMPEVLARLGHIHYFAAGILLCLGSITATLMLLTAWGPIGRHRHDAALLGAAAKLDVVAAWKFRGWGVAIFFTVGHVSALLLLGRSLVPAGGRRGGWTVSAGFLVLLGFEALYAGTFFFAFTLSSLEGRAPWIFVAAGVLLDVALVLIPRPNRSAPLMRTRPAMLYGTGAAIVAVSALALLAASEPGLAIVGGMGHTEPMPLRVATYNVHAGFNEAWRYDPESIARAIERSNSSVVALQELPVGVPFAYGTDLALWLGHRLKMRADFAPAVNQLLGDAVLSRLPVLRMRSWQLRVDQAVLGRAVDPKVVIAEDVFFAGKSVRVYGARLDGAPEVQRLQLRQLVNVIGPGAAVFMGDLKADEGSPAGSALRTAGFTDAFESAGRSPAPTTPQRVPTQRADWIWVRGFPARNAYVLDADGSDHRLVAAELLPGNN